MRRLPLRPLHPARRLAHGARRLAGAARCRLADQLINMAGVRSGLDPTGTGIALTFDDGPDPVSTPAVLDELRRLEVVATFFVVGRRARAFPDIVRRIVAEGHAIGSHSDSHPQAWRVPVRTLVREYRRGRSEVEWAAQRPVHLFRPPNGFVNGFGAVAMVAARVGPWLWTIDPGDWRPGALPSDVLAGCEGLSGGDVVLLHDGIDGPDAPSSVDRSVTTEVLSDIVALARERGLHFTTLA